MSQRHFIITSAAVISLIAGIASAQQPPANPNMGAMGQRGNETPRHSGAAAAATRAVALCSGLWSGAQTRAMIDRDSPEPRGVTTVVHEQAKVVSSTYDAALPPRIVVWRPVLGCVQLPPFATMADAKHVIQAPKGVRAPNLDDRPWPMGDRDAMATLPAAKQAAVDKLVGLAFDGKTYAGRTWGVIVVVDGKIVAERYAMDFGPHIGGQTHSAAKSFAGTLAGVAVRKDRFDIQRQGALKEWRTPGDPRSRITPEHLLQMRSGLYGEGGGSPQQDIYSAGGTVAGRAASNILDTAPGTRFLYNPPDTMLLMRAVREAVNNDARYSVYPHQELFWKVGMTRTTPTSDWNGDYLLSGQTYSTARDFARFGLFTLNGGKGFDGTTIITPEWQKYITTPGPVQPSGTGPRYGGQFWLYGGQSGLPADAYSPNGGQGQYAMTIPSRKVVVVRRGYDAGGTFQIAKFSADVLAALN